MRDFLRPLRIAISIYGLAITDSTEARVMRIMWATMTRTSVTIGRNA
jgi:hypothetical protein